MRHATLTRAVLASTLALLLTAAPAAAAGGDEPLGGIAPPIHQDSVHLTRVTAGVLPPDGLLSLELGGRQYSTVLLLDGQRERLSQRDFFLRTEASPLPWLALAAEVPWRSWSQGRGWVPPSGSGLGDGLWRLTVGRSLWGERLAGSLSGGGNLPLGDRAAGLGEGVFSPRLLGALTVRFWRDATVPELRIHLNAGWRWNRAEDTGYGVDHTGLQPWPPRYPSAVAAGGPDRNDSLLLGAAVEFRKGTNALWLEYSQETIEGLDGLDAKEQFRQLAAGLRWGIQEKWALHASWEVGLSRDDYATDWEPAYPEMVSTIALSRQFSIGGRDSDGDGVVDRKDHCLRRPEDRDGFQDGDGCPDPDNDGDGVPDAVDGAPNRAEDRDGFEDGDGVPDLDNDGDGILDVRDLCPDEAEDFDGISDDDGCPDDVRDRDGDGIADRDDGCPDQAEDLDGWEDDDGCPEADNDLDGIPDAQDACPDEPEDYDGDADKDGCPD